MKYIKLKIFIVAIAIFGVSFLIVKYWLTDKTVQEKQKITIGTFSKSMGNVPFYIAKENGWFEKAIGDQFKIEYYEYNDRSSIASAISAGKLKFVFSAEAPAMLIEAQGEDIEFVNLQGTLIQEVIVRSSSTMKHITDLKGLKVAVLAGTSSHYALIKILNDNNMSIDDIDLAFMPPAEAKTAFETGLIDAWAVWPPWVEQQQVTGFAKSLEGSDAFIQTVGSMPKSYVVNNPEIADSLSSTINKAKLWMIDNPEKAQNITASQIQLDIEVVKLAWTKFNWAAKFDAKMLEDMQNKADFLAEEKLTRNNMVINVKKDLIGDLIQK